MTELLSCSCPLDKTGPIIKLMTDLAKNGPRLFALHGPLGAGKTTLAKEVISSLLGIQKELITSPTFNYVNTYETKEQTAHHFDLYRLKNLASFEAMGFADYLDQTCFIEWPEIISDILPEETLHIYIDYKGEARTYKITTQAQEAVTHE